jgi:hypothetical protein
MQGARSNPIPSHVNHGYFKNIESIQVKLSTCIIFTLIIQYNIETINYKGKNPQVNLIGSNPNPKLIYLILHYNYLVYGSMLILNGLTTGLILPLKVQIEISKRNFLIFLITHCIQSKKIHKNQDYQLYTLFYFV